MEDPIKDDKSLFRVIAIVFVIICALLLLMTHNIAYLIVLVVGLPVGGIVFGKVDLAVKNSDTTKNAQSAVAAWEWRRFAAGACAILAMLLVAVIVMAVMGIVMPRNIM